MFKPNTDEVVEIEDFPQSSIGAPCPMFVSSEGSLSLAYFLRNTPENWDGTTCRVIDENSQGEPTALVEFVRPYMHKFGPPNEEAFEGHPLYEKGLLPHRIFEVKNSSWLKSLIKMNSIHPCHKDEHFSAYKHFVFSFHDTTFECVAESFKFSVHSKSVLDVITSIVEERKKGD